MSGVIATGTGVTTASGGGVGVTDGDKGEVVVASAGLAWTLKPEAIDDRVAGLLVAGANVILTYNDGAGTLTVAAAGGGGTGGAATVTVPASRYEHEETVAAVGVTGSSRIMLSLGAMDDQSENAADMLDIASMGATPGTGTLTIRLAFSTLTAGAIPINWSAA